MQMTTSSAPIHDILKSIETEEAGWGDDKRWLKCPICDFNYSHIEAPRLLDGGDNYLAEWGGRGDLALVPMWSECGSKWEVCIGFHKGQSAIFTRVIESCKDKKSF